MLARGPVGTNGQPQPILQPHPEVLVWHRLWLLVLELDQGLEETSSARASTGAQIHPLVLGKLPEQGVFADFPQLRRPETLKPGPRRAHETDPIHWLERTTRVLDQLALGAGQAFS